jgi:DNA-binding response OmpR family regulator
MKLLLIEDHLDTADVMLLLLRKCGYEVDLARDGKTGLKLALEQSYAGILLDVSLPVMDGFEVLKNLRTKTVEAPVLLLSGFDEVRERVRRLGIGADDYLCKPFEIDDLLSRVRALIQ